MIEAIELVGRPNVVGVQWHPELLTHLSRTGAVPVAGPHGGRSGRTANPGAGAPDRLGGVKLNPYAQLIVDEALARGIGVTVLDPSIGELLLSFGDRTVHTLESLSDLTSAVAFRRCDDKALTRTVLERAGLRLPAGRLATFDQADVAFLDEWGDIVVKPARGEAGRGSRSASPTRSASSRRRAGPLHVSRGAARAAQRGRGPPHRRDRRRGGGGLGPPATGRRR